MFTKGEKLEVDEKYCDKRKTKRQVMIRRNKKHERYGHQEKKKVKRRKKYKQERKGKKIAKKEVRKGNKERGKK